MKKIFISALTFLSFIISCGIAEAKTEENLPYHNPTPGRITIAASTPIPQGVAPTRQAYEDLIDCGFRVGLEMGDMSFFDRAFRIIGDLDFKYMIANDDLHNGNRMKWIRHFKNNPHFAGWKFKDEPSYASLDALEKEYYALYKDDPDNMIYLNLIGIKTPYFLGKIKTYPAYLDMIQKRFRPSVWSYDFYPIWYNNKGQFIVDYNYFYSDLENYMAISKKTNRPFWAYCESMEYNSEIYNRPAATEAYLRFEAFSALAYGAQGIVYWTYGQRKSNAQETYISALVNLDGKKTPAWHAAKKVNSEIIKFNDVFYQCKVLNVRHTGVKLYDYTKKLSGSFGPIKMIRSGDSGVMVSRIENKGEKYIVIVSRDVVNAQRVTIELGNNNKLTDITVNPVEYDWRSPIEISLEAGGYRIFKES